MRRPYRIVVGYDGSESAGRALDRAVGLTGYGSLLRVVYVADSPDGIERGRTMLSEVEERLARGHVLGETAGRVGDPANELIEAVREEDADLLVVGDGDGTVPGENLGSVSTTLLQLAPCDVLVAR